MLRQTSSKHMNELKYLYEGVLSDEHARGFYSIIFVADFECDKLSLFIALAKR